jgi:hypothetical protein
VVSKYVGPVTDKLITDRVVRFAGIKSDFKRRREMVRALAAGLPMPDSTSGAVIEAMWKAGFFRLRGVLVGTLAFQADAGPLGILLGGRPLMTQDVDGAQPLRHLDFLIDRPERSVLLFGGGVPVTIPRAERYAVHELIVAVERTDQAKSAKDIMQAGTLLEALARKTSS